MKLALLFLAALAWGQVPGKWVGDTRMTVNEAANIDSAICWIDARNQFHFVKGKEKLCWEMVVRAHNEGMNDPHMHQEFDFILQTTACAFRKRVIPCAK